MNGRLAASSPRQGEALKVREAHLDSASALARPLSHGWGSAAMWSSFQVCTRVLHPAAPGQVGGGAGLRQSWPGQVNPGRGLLKLPALRSEAQLGPSGYFSSWPWLRRHLLGMAQTDP